MWTEPTAKASALPVDTTMRSLCPNFIDSRIASPLDGLLDQWSQDKKVHILYDIGDVVSSLRSCEWDGRQVRYKGSIQNHCNGKLLSVEAQET